jgi:predicted MPP superfamily phosphohydrolase
MFPPAGRVDPREAPGGTTASPIRRLRLDERFDFQTTTHRMPVEGLERPLRVLHLSDVHLRGPEPWVDALCGRLGDLDAPDLTVLTGDVIARGFDRGVVDRFLAAVPRGRLGTFAVIGNWEVWGGAPRETWQPIVEGHGIPLLHDRSVDLGPLTLVGTDDALSGHPDLDAAFREVAPHKPAVVLTHSPVLFPELTRAPVALVLAGHTHGGQVRLPGLGPFFLPRGSGDYPWGWYERDGVWLFVHRGLGWSVAPWRWRAPPEIAWIELGGV